MISDVGLCLHLGIKICPEKPVWLIEIQPIWCLPLPFSYPPAFLQRLVDQDNHKFEEWCSEMADMRKQSVDKGKAKHEEVKELYELLPAKDGR